MASLLHFSPPGSIFLQSVILFYTQRETPIFNTLIQFSCLLKMSFLKQYSLFCLFFFFFSHVAKENRAPELFALDQQAIHLTLLVIEVVEMAANELIVKYVKFSVLNNEIFAVIYLFHFWQKRRKKKHVKLKQMFVYCRCEKRLAQIKYAHWQ